MLLIFDWDGTLCDSKQKITSAMQMAAEDLGWQPLEDHKIHNIIGLGLPEAIRSLYPSIPQSDYQRLRDAYAKVPFVLHRSIHNRHVGEPPTRPGFIRLPRQNRSIHD